jgi:hypothetical protein
MGYAVVFEYLKGVISDKRVLEEVYRTLMRGAVNSGEAEDSGSGMKRWFDERYMPNSVILDMDDYSKALIRSLWLAPNLAALDFTGGRLRDFAQLWTDTSRGFLGEIAIQKFLKENFGLNVHLETRRGKAAEFMASDILVMEKGKTEPRKSSIKVSIKTTKFNGRWLEIPESQFRQSDVFAFVKLGISRYHFSAYLKTLKVIEQLFKKGEELEELNEEQIKTLSGEIPEWMPIPAYIAGFVDKAGLKLPIHSLSFRTPRKQKAISGVRPISRIEIEGGIGLFYDSVIRESEKIKALGIGADTPINIAGINKDADGNFYASSGLLDFEKEKWLNMIKKI